MNEMTSAMFFLITMLIRMKDVTTTTTTTVLIKLYDEIVCLYHCHLKMCLNYNTKLQWQLQQFVNKVVKNIVVMLSLYRQYNDRSVINFYLCLLHL